MSGTKKLLIRSLLTAYAKQYVYSSTLYATLCTPCSGCKSVLVANKSIIHFLIMKSLSCYVIFDDHDSDHFDTQSMCHYPSTMNPQCHPERSRAQSESDLQAEQDEFFLSGSVNSVKLVSSESSDNVRSCHTPSVPVLNDVIERSTGSIKAPQPPVFKAPLKPAKIQIKSNEESIIYSDDLDALKDKISHENDEKLSKMSAKEIEVLKSELFESVPESFLEKLRNKQ